MRALLAVAFVIVTSVAAFTYRDLLLGGNRTVQRPREAPVRLAVTSQSPTEVALTLVQLAAADSQINHHMMLIQESPELAPQMVELAFFYMKHGWYDRAIGPLARAREIDVLNEAIGRYLELAMARAGKGYVDLYQAARDFEEMVAMWGEGC